MVVQTNQEISERISLISVSSTMKVAADAERLRTQGVDVVDFGAGEPDFPTPDNIKRAAIRALEQNFTKYTNAGGTLELKQAVCEKHAADFGTDYQPGECLIAVGGKHAIFNLTQALLNPGDEVVIPVPYWVTYKDVVNYAGGKCVFVDTDEEQGFALTADMIEPYLTDRTKMVFINSPSNPSGALVDREEFEKIYRLTAARGIFLLTDECYCHFLYDSQPFSIASLAGAKENVLVAGTVSKTYAMTGWRIGYGVMRADLAVHITRLMTNSNSCTASFTQMAGIEALCGDQSPVGRMCAEFQRRSEVFVAGLNKIKGFSCRMPKGAFYVFPNITGTGWASKPLADALLDQAGVAALSGTAFGQFGEGYLRFSVANSLENLEQALERIDQWTKQNL
jgi:aspartate aminotransferase